MRRLSGFSLIEVAIAIFIIALLLGSLMTPFQTRIDVRYDSETSKMLSEARDALLGFAMARGYLPCPDTDNDGVENVTGNNCSASSGSLPFATLGLSFQSDPWGNRFRYRLEVAYGARSPLFTLSTQANIRVCNTTPCPTKDKILTNYDPAAPVPGDEAVAVILSHGKNGAGAVSYSTGATNTAPTSADEIANTGTGPFVYRTRAEAGAASGEFDDLVIWLGKPTLFGRMIAAGKLP